MSVGLGWAVAGVLVCVPAVAMAEEEPSKTADQKEEQAPPIERHRLTLGMTVPSGGVGTSNGGVGGLGTIPYATAGYEARMAGPAWFLLALNGGLAGNTAEDGYEESSSWYAGGTIGVRIEVPVHDYVEVGGHGRFGGGLGSYVNGGGNSDSWQLGAEAGAGIHFRPTRLFGVRLCIDVLDWGYREDFYGGGKSTGVYAHLKADPSLDLTFSF